MKLSVKCSSLTGKVSDVVVNMNVLLSVMIGKRVWSESSHTSRDTPVKIPAPQSSRTQSRNLDSRC